MTAESHVPHGTNGTNGAAAAATPIPTLDVRTQLEGSRLLILGGTGFLGKIFWVMMLARYPSIGRIYLLVRASKTKTSEQRFWAEVATSECLDPLRAQHGDQFEAFLKQRIVPINGDVGLPNCGIDSALLAELKGTIDAVVNVAGVVDFNPPLDEALDTNAFGAQNLVELSKALGNAPLMHTSTCYVVGNRKGLIMEEKPGSVHPFPRSEELGAELWNPKREIDDCLDLIAQAKSRAEDAFRQSEFMERAKKNLLRRGEPTIGKPLEAELKTVKRKYVSDRLVEAGLERATHWGWPNISTYTKSIGEQIIASSGIPYTVARPACCESTIEFPFPGWNEGIGTSAPIIFLVMKGHHQILGRDAILDFIPADIVCAGMILTLVELLEGTAKPTYQYGASDVNPATSERFGELIGLYKRKYYQRTGKGNPFVNFIQQHMEPAVVDRERFQRVGPGAIAKASKVVARVLKSAPGPAAAIGKPAGKALEAFARQDEKIDFILTLFAPFTLDQKGPFSCANTHAAYARLSSEDRARLPWYPEKIDWADYWMNQHMPAMEKRVLPWMDEKYKKELAPLRSHETLASLVDQMAERHEHAVAFGRVEDDGIARTTFADVRTRADAVAARLAALGVKKGERVVLSAHNHPDWPIAFFGIVRAGATCVPVDPALEPSSFVNVVRESEARVVVWDAKVEAAVGDAVRGMGAGAILTPALGVLTDALPQEGDPASLARPAVDVYEDDIASLIYTSGTTGKPKGVRLSHSNFTSIIAALAPLFPLNGGDRVLSVLPLHHTFEFTAGLVLPFSRGARVVYLDELKGDRVSHALKLSRATAMVGVPAVWQLLERRILSQVSAKGPVAEKAFDLAAELNRKLGKSTGIDLGKLLFGPVHEGLGGSIKYLISGGAALPKDTADLFAGLGFKLTEGYGLTEASPVLTVAKAGSAAGQVGKPIPGVSIKIDAPDEHGVGEVLARGANVMTGYTDEEATKEVLTGDGWLRTGDLGKLDRKGQLVLAGRVKDVIVTSTGENVYPDDIERLIGKVAHIEELAVVGVTGRSGGERVGLIAKPEDDDTILRSERLDRANKALREAINKLPYAKQPTVVHLYDAALPRTATRKVKRTEARKMLERMIAATSRPDDGETEAPSSPVRVAIAAVKGKKVTEIHGDLTMADELGFDSLALTELLVALEAKYGALDPKELQSCLTVADVEALVGTERASLRPQQLATQPGGRYAIEGRDAKKTDKTIVLPEPVQEQGKKLIGKVQDFFYGEMMRSKITGRAFIPHNRNTIVVANHGSHLDMGFARHALGSYGEDIVTLAAQDYFFEKGTLSRAFFENLTNLKSLDRKGGLRASERQAGDILQRGKTMLIFPEGTRSTDGEVHEFKPLLGHLALTYGVDILPLYLGGTRDAMPKGSRVPTKRDLFARIGPPITVADMRRLTEGLSPADASREVAKLARRAVDALKKGEIVDASRMKSLSETAEPEEHPLVTLFAHLETKFSPAAVEKPMSFYFTLGDDANAKWTVRVSKEKCEVKAGKPEGGTADCVLKTSPEIFTKIVRDAFTPGPAEFISGQIKSNDIELLMTFQKVFQLAP
ncbi:MAG: Long-chain-fatty-acid CoA ligase [Labilithrix sp.]|nr:Long-chain-fatty-acid CoA ligase [Labilithrix sp.]